VAREFVVYITRTKHWNHCSSDTPGDWIVQSLPGGSGLLNTAVSVF